MKKKDGKKKGVAVATKKTGGNAAGGSAGGSASKEAGKVAGGAADARERHGGVAEAGAPGVAEAATEDHARGNEIAEVAVAASEVMTLEQAKAKLENLRRTIRKLLNEQGKYRKELTYQVEVAASTLMAWRKVRDEAITVKSIVLRETSREGDERWKAHPIFEMYAKMTDVLRRDLRALQMNKEREKALEEDAEGGDGLTELMAALNEE